MTPDSLANSVSALLTNDTHDTSLVTRHPSTVYVGVDVFGRGCMGGGGFQCNQALREIRKRGMSVAIFAPGWTYEIPHRDREKCGDIQVSLALLKSFNSIDSKLLLLRAVHEQKVTSFDRPFCNACGV